MGDQTDVKAWTREEVERLVEFFASRESIELSFLRALIQTESSWNVFAERAEPGWKYFYNVRDFSELLHSTYDTESRAQARSYGICQIMGSVAREYGFKGWLAQLYCPEVNLKYSCMHIKAKSSRFGDDPATLYASYNAGSPRKLDSGMFSNQRNVDNFMRNYRELTK